MINRVLLTFWPWWIGSVADLTSAEFVATASPVAVVTVAATVLKTLLMLQLWLFYGIC